MIIDVSSNVIGKCVYIAGQRGSGKSWACGVLLENLLDAGYICLVIDAEGDNQYVEGVEHIKASDDIVDYVYNNKVSVVVDATDLTKKQLKAFIKKVSLDLMRIGLQKKMPLFLFVDEAEMYAGQTGYVEEFIDLISLGRKRGIGIVLAGHRVARLNKDVLGECDVAVFKKLVQDVDIKRAVDYLKQIKMYTKQEGIEFGKRIMNLQVNEALKVDGEAEFIKIGQRKFPHGGDTPTFNNSDSIDSIDRGDEYDELVLRLAKFIVLGIVIFALLEAFNMWIPAIVGIIVYIVWRNNKKK